MSDDLEVGSHLGYFFWHAPTIGVGPREYESVLGGWQQALRAAPPPGSLGGWTWSLPRPPWLAGWPESVYLDVYVVESFEALGALNRSAVTDERKEPHDATARLAGYGSGALFSCRSGVASPPPPAPEGSRVLAWYEKERGVPYRDLLAALAGPERTVWRRQMVLGAGPELMVVSAGGVLEGIEPVWSSRAVALEAG